MKLHGEWAGGSNPVQAGLVAVRSLGGWGEVDGVAEGLQLADQPAFGGVGVVVAGEPVSAKIAVAGTVVEDEPDDHQQVVGDRDGGLAAALLAEPAVQPAEAGTQVGAGPASGPGRLDQRLADLTVALAGLAAAVLAGRLVVARAQPSPGGQVVGAREAGHVDADPATRGRTLRVSLRNGGPTMSDA